MSSPACIVINELLYKRKASVTLKAKELKQRIRRMQMVTTTSFHKQQLPSIKSNHTNQSTLKCEIITSKLKIPTNRSNRIILPKVKNSASSYSPQRNITDCASNVEIQSHTKQPNTSTSFIRLKPLPSTSDTPYTSMDCIGDLIKITHGRTEDFIILETIIDFCSNRLKVSTIDAENTLSHLEAKEIDRIAAENSMRDRMTRLCDSENIRKYAHH